MPRRIPVWKVALGFVLLVGVGLGLIVWDAHRRAYAVLKRHGAEVSRRKGELDVRSEDRPPLSGPEIDMDARVFYENALAGLKNLTPDDYEAFPRLSELEVVKPDDDRLRLLRDRLRPMIEDLRNASRSKRSSRLISWPPSETTADYGGRITLSKVLADLIDHLHRVEEHAEAAEFLSLGLFMAQDVRRNGAVLDAAVVNVMEDVLSSSARRILSAHAFEASVLKSLATQVDRCLGEASDWQGVLDAEDVYMRAALLGLLDQAPNPLMKPGWRDLLSLKFLIVRKLGEHARLYERVRETSTLPWGEQFRAVRALDPEDGSVRMDLDLLPRPGQWFRMEASRRLSLVLLRATLALALHEVETGRVAPTLDALIPRYLPAHPVCPVSGSPLRYADGRVWSLGANGIDDSGTWDPDEHPDPYGRDCLDVVWKAARKK